MILIERTRNDMYARVKSFETGFEFDVLIVNWDQDKNSIATQLQAQIDAVPVYDPKVPLKNQISFQTVDVVKG